MNNDSWSLRFTGINKDPNNSFSQVNDLHIGDSVHFHAQLTGAVDGTVLLYYETYLNGEVVDSGPFSQQYGNGAYVWVRYTPAKAGTLSVRLFYYENNNRSGREIDLGMASAHILNAVSNSGANAGQNNNTTTAANNKNNSNPWPLILLIGFVVIVLGYFYLNPSAAGPGKIEGTWSAVHIEDLEADIDGIIHSYSVDAEYTFYDVSGDNGKVKYINRSAGMSEQGTFTLRNNKLSLRMEGSDSSVPYVYDFAWKGSDSFELTSDELVIREQYKKK